MEQIISQTNNFKLIVDIHSRRVSIELFKLENSMYSNIFHSSIRAVTDADKVAAISLCVFPLSAYFGYEMPDIRKMWETKKIVQNV